MTDNHYSSIAGKWVDVKLEVVGGNYIIFNVLYESLIDGIYSNVKLSNDFINVVLEGKYNYVVITDEEWNNRKNEYINNIKNGIKYELLFENTDKEFTPICVIIHGHKLFPLCNIIANKYPVDIA